MKKYLDKLKSNIHINKNLFVFLMVLITIGLISGALFSIIISSEDKALVNTYLNDFFSNVKNNKLDYHNSLINALIFTLGCGCLIWILGISVIGFFIILFILFLKSFILGFSVGSIIYSFKLKGLILSIIYIFPHQVINVLIFMILSAFSLMFSYKLICSLKKKKSITFGNIMNKYIIVLIFSLIVLTTTSIYEIYLLPK